MSDFTETLTKIETIKNTHERVDVSNFYVSNHVRENDCCIPSEDWEMILYYDFDPWCLIDDITEHWTPELKRKVAKIWWEEFKTVNTDDYGQTTEPFMFWPEGTDQFDIMEAFKDFFDIDVIEDKEFMSMIGFANGDYLVNALKRNQKEKEMTKDEDYKTKITDANKKDNEENHPMTSYGNCMNLWTTGGDYDVFIIMHEAESQDNFDRIIGCNVEDTCHAIMQNNNLSIKEKKEIIKTIIDAYTDYGIQVIIKERK